METNGYQRSVVDYSGLCRGREPRSQRRKSIFFGFMLIMAIVLLFVLKCRFPFDSFFVGDEKGVKSEQFPVSASEEMRKNIYDRNLDSMAVSFQLVSIYARPLELADIRDAADKLAPVLGRDADKLYGDLKAERSYEWLAKHVSPVLAAKIADLDLPGVYFSYENERFYPHNSLAAHVLGFVNDEQGLAGVESYYDSRLRSGVARQLTDGSHDVSPGETSQPGHLVLTLDLKIQALLENDLQKLLRQTGAKQAMAALMEIDSGAILALANVPAFNPNSFWLSSAESLANRVVSERIKPGPLNRLFMLAAGIREGRVSWEEPTEMEIFHGKQLLPRMRKKRVHGPLLIQWHSFSSGFLGSPELADFDSELSSDALSSLSVILGFDKDRQLDLAAARLKGADDKSVSKDNGSYLFAEDNTVTGLSLLTGFSWLVNGGHQVKPYLLQETINNDGQRQSLSHAYGQLVGFTPEMSRQFTSILADKVKADRRFYFGQSLAFVKGEINNRSQDKDESAKSENVTPRFQVTLLGMGPISRPQLSLVVVLDGAGIDLSSYPPGQSLFNEFMGQAVSLLNSSGVKEDGVPQELDYQEIYNQWLAEHNLPRSSGDDVGQIFERMPDLRGYSLRKALKILQPAKMRITVHGAGWVSSQHPRPGTGIDSEECVLNLTME